MKIEQVEHDEKHKIITIWTDEVKDVGFNFKLSEITDKEDLKNKVKQRVTEYKAKQNQEITNKEKYNQLKKAEGEIIE